MVQVLEQDTLPDVVEATLNYIVDTGEKIFTETAAPGSTDVRSGGRQDPRRITIRNGRQFADKFVLEQNGFPAGASELKMSEEDAYLTLQRESRQRRKLMKEVAEAVILSDELKHP